MRIFEHAANHPDDLALDDLDRRRTWSELVDRVHRVAGLLRDEWGLGPGEHVASVMGNRVEWFELTLATTLTGIWLVPVNTHLHPEEVAHVLADAEARAVLTDADRRPLVEAAGATGMVEVGDELDRLLATAPDRPVGLEGPPGGRMHYTSGTTGRPKGVKRQLPDTAGAYLELMADMGRSVGLDGSGPHLMTGPHYHAAVGGYALFDLCNGAPVVSMPRFDAGQVLGLIEQFQVTHTHLVPTMFVRLLRLPQPERERFDPAPLQQVLHGAAPIAPATKQAMIEWWGPVLVEYWGASEAGTFTLCTSQEWQKRPGTVGRPLAGVEVVALDEDGERLPASEQGRLACRLRGNPAPFHYHRDPARTAEVMIGDGWFALGDVGRLDREGYVYLLGRGDDVVISGGVNIYPAEVESVLGTHPAVADAAVFGVPDPEWGEQVKAVVQAAPGVRTGPTLARELIGHVREHLAGYKAPRSVDFVDSLPRLPSGKLLVRQLRDPYWSADAEPPDGHGAG